MLEKPELHEQRLISRIEAEYRIRIAKMIFLPWGVDTDTAVYRLEAVEGSTWFLKLRKGSFDEISLTLPVFFKSEGVSAVIAPWPNGTGRHWSACDEWRLIIYPFIEGRNGYEAALTDRNWLDFGSELRRIHDAALPAELSSLVRREDFSSRWRDLASGFQVQAENGAFSDPAAASLAIFMRQKRTQIKKLIVKAARLAERLQAGPRDVVICHSDLHPGNLLITATGELFIVDWDAPILAPREHDLMHIGGSHIWPAGRSAELFYRGYGPVEIDPQAQAYYRCERIIQDISAFCQQLFLSDDGGTDRQQALRYFTGQFEPGHEVEIALRDGR